MRNFLFPQQRESIPPARNKAHLVVTKSFSSEIQFPRRVWQKFSFKKNHFPRKSPRRLSLPKQSLNIFPQKSQLVFTKVLSQKFVSSQQELVSLQKPNYDWWLPSNYPQQQDGHPQQVISLFQETQIQLVVTKYLFPVEYYLCQKRYPSNNQQAVYQKTSKFPRWSYPQQNSTEISSIWQLVVTKCSIPSRNYSPHQIADGSHQVVKTQYWLMVISQIFRRFRGSPFRALLSPQRSHSLHISHEKMRSISMFMEHYAKKNQ